MMIELPVAMQVHEGGADACRRIRLLGEVTRRFAEAVVDERESPVSPTRPRARTWCSPSATPATEQVRTLVRGILRRAGYQVIEATSSGDAIVRCRDHDGQIHLLLTDVVMPRIGGHELSERLQPIRPTMKILFMSGYTENAIVRHGILELGINYLQKPITPDALLRKVRQVLDA